AGFVPCDDAVAAACGFAGRIWRITNPSAFEFTVSGTSIAGDGVSVITFFISGDNAVATCCGDATVSTTHPAFFELAGAGTSIARGGVSVVAFFIAADDAVAADIFIWASFGRVFAANVFNLAQFVATVPRIGGKVRTTV